MDLKTKKYLVFSDIFNIHTVKINAFESMNAQKKKKDKLQTATLLQTD